MQRARGRPRWLPPFHLERREFRLPQDVQALFASQAAFGLGRESAFGEVEAVPGEDADGTGVGRGDGGVQRAVRDLGEEEAEGDGSYAAAPVGGVEAVSDGVAVTEETTSDGAEDVTVGEDGFLGDAGDAGGPVGEDLGPDGLEGVDVAGLDHRHGVPGWVGFEGVEEREVGGFDGAERDAGMAGRWCGRGGHGEARVGKGGGSGRAGRAGNNSEILRT